MHEGGVVADAGLGSARDAFGADVVYGILEVAYLLASIDGVIREEEDEEFRATSKMLLGDRFESEEAIAFFARMHSLSKTVMDLSKFYGSSDARIKILELYARTPVETVGRSVPGVVRRAFAFWLGMCCSDKEYSPVERKAIDALRRSVVAVNPAALPLLSDRFFEELERRVLGVNDFERSVLDAKGIEAKEKDAKLQEQMQSFGRFIDTFE